MSDFSISISADSVAWYAAIVATVSMGVSMLSAWRDRAQIIISHQKGMKIVNAFHRYSEDKCYFIVTIRNKGRRPVSVGAVGVILITGESFLLGDSIMNTNNSNRVLTEENPETQIISEEDSLDFTKLSYIQVFDKAGREYRKYVHKFPKLNKIMFRFSNILKNK